MGCLLVYFAQLLSYFIDSFSYARHLIPRPRASVSIRHSLYAVSYQTQNGMPPHSFYLKGSRCQKPSTVIAREYFQLVPNICRTPLSRLVPESDRHWSSIHSSRENCREQDFDFGVATSRYLKTQVFQSFSASL